jgi:hypothetical protein
MLAASAGLFFADIPVLFFLLLGLPFLKVITATIKTFCPKPAILFHPMGNFFERAGVQLARSPLRRATTGNQSGMFQHFQALGHCRKAHGERLGKFGDRKLAKREPSEDGAPRGVRQGGKSEAEWIGHRIKPSG